MKVTSKPIIQLNIALGNRWSFLDFIKVFLEKFVETRPFHAGADTVIIPDVRISWDALDRRHHLHIEIPQDKEGKFKKLLEEFCKAHNLEPDN